jgi:methyltransferase (TIGR00027 family)
VTPDRDRKAVADTGLLVAAIRARESAREGGLFDDPFAHKLAGATGEQLLAEAIAVSGEQSTAQIVVRTRFFDDALLRSAPAVKQVVILAAGMDARAFRLSWPGGTTVYEVDQPGVIEAKDELLQGETPRCRRVAVGVDLAHDWPSALTSAGFDATAPSAWLIEGLLQYLDENAVQGLFDRVAALAARGSRLLYDMVGKALLESPVMAPLLRSMAENGAPWLFGTDAPGELAERRGWKAIVTDIAVPGNEWGRWFVPVIPIDVPDAPRGYFVEARR